MLIYGIVNIAKNLLRFDSYTQQADKLPHFPFKVPPEEHTERRVKGGQPQVNRTPSVLFGHLAGLRKRRKKSFTEFLNVPRYGFIHHPNRPTNRCTWAGRCLSNGVGEDHRPTCPDLSALPSFFSSQQVALPLGPAPPLGPSLHRADD